MSENVAYSGRSEYVRYAHVPTSSKVCGFCCMVSSMDFVYKNPKRPSLHEGCRCLIVPGIKNKTVLGGYEPDVYRKGYELLVRRDEHGKIIRNENGIPTFKSGLVFDVRSSSVVSRLNNASDLKSSAFRYYPMSQSDIRSFNIESIPNNISSNVLSSRFYIGITSDMKFEAEILESMQKEAWHLYKITKDYQGTFGKFLNSFSSKGSVSSQFGAHPDGKEIQIGLLFARNGHNVNFLFAGSEQNHHYPDMMIDDEIWEIKRITSTNPRKLRCRIGEGAEQSKNVIVDLCINDGNMQELVPAAATMVEDERISKIIVIAENKAIIFEKK